MSALKLNADAVYKN